MSLYVLANSGEVLYPFNGRKTFKDLVRAYIRNLIRVLFYFSQSLELLYEEIFI